jgi:hypothetical protein
MRVHFEIVEADGQTVSDTSERVPDLAALLKVDERSKRAMAAAWAEKVFAHHRGARAIRVKVEAYEIPSMEEFRQGGEPTWRRSYEGSFVPNAG